MRTMLSVFLIGVGAGRMALRRSMATSGIASRVSVLTHSCGSIRCRRGFRPGRSRLAGGSRAEYDANTGWQTRAGRERGWEGGTG